jgi:hypothetical protein|tara:strand:- start:524 stop:898 length:375 start_codon:yes stop_codon:yes gene_type:complete
MSKLQAAGAIGKTIGYVVWAMNNTLKLAKNATHKSIGYITNRNKYNLEVTVQNKTIKTETGVNTSQVIALLETMHNFGNVEIRITNGGTRYDKETKVGTAPDGNNKRSSTSEETTVYTYDTFEV